MVDIHDTHCICHVATLLDIGAGDGGVTRRLEDMFQHVEVTETNTIMRWRLWWNGFKVIHDEESWLRGESFYSVISCLNVLDR
jgi:S-adenosylhomocysteine hydrolase